MNLDNHYEEHPEHYEDEPPIRWGELTVMLILYLTVVPLFKLGEIITEAVERSREH